MNILQYTDFLSEKPTVFQIRKNDKIQQFAVALGKNCLLKKHTTNVPTNLIVMRGELKFTFPDQEVLLKEFDVFEIPVDVEHEVWGLEDENLFVITKELAKDVDIFDEA